jgi:hypothetical protein
MARVPAYTERGPITWREEALWSLFGFALLVVFILLLIQDQA